MGMGIQQEHPMQENVTFMSDGLKICMTMNPNKDCGSPEGLCYGEGCSYSLFNKDQNCCPTETVPF